MKTSKWPATLSEWLVSKYAGLGAALADGLIIGFSSGIGVTLALGVADIALKHLQVASIRQHTKMEVQQAPSEFATTKAKGAASTTKMSGHHCQNGRTSKPHHQRTWSTE